MQLYGSIDLHSNNNFSMISDQEDRVISKKKLANKLEEVDGFFSRYKSELSAIVVESTYNGYWLVDGLKELGYAVKLANNLSDKRDKIIEEMAKRGAQCGNYFQTIHLQPFYKKEFLYKEGDFPIAENISKRTLALPFFNNLTEKEIDFVVNNLKDALLNV